MKPRREAAVLGRTSGPIYSCIDRARRQCLSQMVMSPRRDKLRSYSGQLLTRNFVLYFGCTREFMLGPTHDGGPE